MEIATKKVKKYSELAIRPIYVIRGSYAHLEKKNTVIGEKDHDVIRILYYDRQSGNIRSIENQDIFLLGEQLLDKQGTEKNLENLSDMILNLMVIQYDVDYISSLLMKKKLINEDMNKRDFKEGYIEIKDYILNYINNEGKNTI